MTVASTVSRNVYNVIVGQTVFPFTFPIINKGDLVVSFQPTGGAITTLVLNVDYAVFGEGQDAGGNVTLLAPAAQAGQLVIQRFVQYTQPTDYKNQGSFYPSTIERSFDRATMQVQQISESIDRTPRFPITTAVSFNATLPGPPIGNALIGVNSEGTATRYFTPQDIATAVAFGNFRYDRFVAAPSQTAFTLAADPGALGNLDVSIDGVVQVPVDDYTLAGTTMTLTSPMTGGEVVLARYGTAAGATDGGSMTWQPAGVGAIQRTVQDRLREVVSILDFGATANGVANDAPALVLAIGSGNRRVILPAGRTYRFDGTTTITQDNVEIVADGATIILGNGVIVGGDCIRLHGSSIKIIGGFWDAAVRTVAFAVNRFGTTQPDGIDLIGCRFRNFFYALFATGDEGATTRARNITVRDCRSLAPAGQNASHFACTYVDGVTYADNQVEGGRNAGAYGIVGCRRVSVTGNRESGVVDTDQIVEAGIQIEGISGIGGDSFCVVSGNSCEHDIWVSDSTDVTVSGNTCRRLRLSVGNPGSPGSRDVQFVGNRAAAILVQQYGPNTAIKISGDFIGNILDPSGVSVFGTPIAAAVSVDMARITFVRIISTNVVTSAATNACSIARGSDARLYLFDNEFGTQPHSISGVGGYIYERNNRVPLYANASGYVSASPTADATLAIGAWTAMPLGTEQVDANDEFNPGTGAFTVAETGTYRLGGAFLFDAIATGDDVGLRLWRTSGTPAELRRLGYAQAGGAGFLSVPVAPTEIRLTAGDVVRLEYFHSAASAGSVLGGEVFSQFQVSRIA
jgi:hypothetical protein